MIVLLSLKTLNMIKKKNPNADPKESFGLSWQDTRYTSLNGATSNIQLQWLVEVIKAIILKANYEHHIEKEIVYILLGHYSLLVLYQISKQHENDETLIFLI